MRKTAVRIVMLIIIFSASHAVAQHEKGQTNINIGFGFGNNYARSSYSYTRSLPLFNISGDYGITQDVSIGASIGFAGYTEKYSNIESWKNNGVWYSYNYTDTYKWRRYIVGARGAYHLGKYIDIDKLDVYGGLMLGVYFSKYSYKTDSPNPWHNVYYVNHRYSGLAWAFFAGARYYFTDKIGIYGEFGYGYTLSNIGLAIKL